MYNTISNCAALVVMVLSIVSMWVLFTKAGEKGWKAIIPLYNGYVEFKLFWKKSLFWITLVLSLVIYFMTTAIIVRHISDTANMMVNITDEAGVSLNDVLNNGQNLSEEEIQSAVDNAVNRVGSDLENGVNSPAANAVKTFVENITIVDGIMLIIISILLIALLVLSIMFSYHLAKSFGHGAGYTVGLIFLPTIFLLILAFGKSKYVGAAE